MSSQQYPERRRGFWPCEAPYVDRILYVLSSATLGHGHAVTARFGTASLPQDGAKTGQDLFRHADRRLRAATPGAGG